MSNTIDLRVTVTGTVHQVSPTGDYPSFVIKYMDGSYEKFLQITLSKKQAEQINTLEPGYDVEATFQSSSKESKTPGRWNNTNWLSKMTVTPF
jgi:hypothetical protein